MCVCACVRLWVCDISSCQRGGWVRSKHSWTSKAEKPFRTVSVSLPVSIPVCFMSVTNTETRRHDCTQSYQKDKKQRSYGALCHCEDLRGQKKRQVCACVFVYIPGGDWRCSSVPCGSPLRLLFPVSVLLIHSSRQEESNLFSVCCLYWTVFLMAFWKKILFQNLLQCWDIAGGVKKIQRNYNTNVLAFKSGRNRILGACR